ncbi:hypothetical protein SAMN06296056_104184 [Priestia filamentosa]|nr:hypothetical protein SAMN06296056_104184 [Priestia filamentosa]
MTLSKKLFAYSMGDNITQKFYHFGVWRIRIIYV